MITMKFKTVEINNIQILCDEVRKIKDEQQTTYIFKYEDMQTAIICLSNNEHLKIRVLETKIEKEGIDILC